MFGLQAPQVKNFAEIRIYWLQQSIRDIRISVIKGRSVRDSYNYIIAQYNLVLAMPASWGANNLKTLFTGGGSACLIEEHRTTEQAEIDRFIANPWSYLQTHPNYTKNSTPHI